MRDFDLLIKDCGVCGLDMTVWRTCDLCGDWVHHNCVAPLINLRLGGSSTSHLCQVCVQDDDEGER